MDNFFAIKRDIDTLLHYNRDTKALHLIIVFHLIIVPTKREDRKRKVRKDATEDS
jgi:hypothetical protein